MSQEQRRLFAKGLIDLANIGAGAMVFGQFVSGGAIDFGLLSLGIIATLTLYFGGYRFSRDLEGEGASHFYGRT